MIKDKIIQKKIKGKVLAVAMTAVMASLFVPMVGNAAEDISDIKFDLTISAANLNTADFDLTKDDCYVDGVCQGHKMTETVSSGNSINVVSGQHYLKLGGADITSTVGSAIKIQNGAKLTLVLDKNNKLTGIDAGIYVSQGADLVIMSVDGTDNNALQVKSNGTGAAIGGHGINGNEATSGGITIESGNIVAQGGNRGAGIGGSGWGTVAANKNITINGGTVIAKGGDGYTNPNVSDPDATLGAPGIGHGNRGGSGSIVINGGNVTAIGGMDDGKKTHALGIEGGTITSVNSGGQTVLVSDGIEGSDNLSGLVWDLKRNKDTGKLIDAKGNEITEDDFISTILTNGVSHGNICTVHNQAVMPADFPAEFNKLVDGEQCQLVIPSGTSFRIPAELDFTTSGIIVGSLNSTIINPGNLHIINQDIGGGTIVKGTWIGSQDMNYRVSFDPENDVSFHDPFVYKGEAYRGDTLPKNEIFEVASNRTVMIGSDWVSCPVDRTGLTHKYIKADMSDSDDGVEVKDAGSYALLLTYGGKTTRKTFTVDPLDINSSGIEVSNIPDQEYKGEPFDVTKDFGNGEIVVIYNGNPISQSDYALQFKQDYMEVGDATLTILGQNNFEGERNKTFKITPILLSDTNTDVTLSLGDSIKYDGNPHKPTVSNVKVTSSHGDEFDLIDSFKTTYECSAGEENYTDAGDINIRITPTGKNFTGECSVKFVIKPRELTVNYVKPARTERQYDGTALIQISEIEIDFTANGPNGTGNVLDGILAADRKEDLIEGFLDEVVTLPVSLTGTLGENNQPLEIPAGVKTSGGYEEVHLDTDMRLSGTKGRNYTVAGIYKTSNQGTNVLTSAITITKRDAPVIDVTAVPEPDEMNEPKFICNLVIEGHESKDVIDPDSDIYYYRCTGEGEEPPAKDDLNSWQTGTLGSLTVGNLSPNSEETFYVMVGATPNVAGTEPQACSVSIPKYPRKDGPPEEQCTLTASETPNENGETYKLTVEPAQVINDIYPEGRYLYSLSEEGPYIGGDPSSLFNNVEPKTEYTAYVKYAATDEYTESETGTPTNSVTTNEGKAQKPTVTCNGTTQSEGEIHFSGTASVSLEYTGGLQDYEIRFTKDGTQPTASSELYGAPFEVSEGITVNAFVIKPGVASSEVTSVKLVRDGDSPSNPSTGTEVELQRLTEETAPALLGATALPTKEIDTFDAVSTPLATPILQQRGYENNNITYADLKIKIKGTDRYATEDDFKNAAGGVIRVTITMDQLKAIGLPAGYDGTTHNFAVTHMFATAGANLGNVETIGTAHNFSKSRDGKSISFDMTSTSPVAFGWADVNNSDPNPVGPGTDDPGNQDPGTDDPGNQDPGTQDPGTQDPNTIVGEGDPRQGAQGTQGNGTTTGTDAGTQGASNDAANALSGIMPKTGDPLSFVPWIAAIVISVGAIAFFATRKKDKKKQTVKKTQAAKKKK